MSEDLKSKHIDIFENQKYNFFLNVSKNIIKMTLIYIESNSSGVVKRINSFMGGQSQCPSQSEQMTCL